MIKPANPPLTPPTKRTLREAALEARQRGIDVYGEAGFARKCMNFERKTRELLLARPGEWGGKLPAIVEGVNEQYYDEDEERLSRVLEYMASEQCDGIERQLALCWLDSRGCGATPLIALKQLLNRLRAGGD